MKKMKIIPLAGLLGLAFTLSGTSALIAQSAQSPSLKTIGTPAPPPSLKSCRRSSCSIPAAQRCKETLSC